MKSIDIYQVDAFTDQPFCGNPAGVVPDAVGLDEEQMQKIAREMALSETAFVFPGATGEYDFEVRFFTPNAEVDLCGHATIATFYLLAKIKRITTLNEVLKLKQKTKAGILDLEVHFADDEPVKVMMDQTEPQHLWTIENVPMIAEIAGVHESDLNLTEALSIPKVYSTGLPDVIMPVKDLETLQQMAPRMDQLATFSRANDMAGLHAFTIQDDIVYARNFAPAYDIDEEAATGTANGALVAYLYDHGYFEGHEGEILVRQGDFMDRPSRIAARIEEHDDHKRIQVGGSAEVVMKGKMRC